jgi:hypothetical protein
VNHHRTYIAELCKKNEATRKINMNTLDACIRLYDSHTPLFELYERISRFPIPFLVFTVKCLELQKEVYSERKMALQVLNEK